MFEANWIMNGTAHTREFAGKDEALQYAETQMSIGASEASVRQWSANGSHYRVVYSGWKDAANNLRVNKD